MMKPHRTRLALGALIISAGVVGTQLAASWAGASGTPTVVGHNAHLPAPEAILKMAQDGLPYRPNIPTGIPAGLALDLVDYGRPEDPDGVPSMDLWYKDANGRTDLHIWQTSLPAETLGPNDDPTLKGTPKIIGGKTWMLLRMERQNWVDIVLSRRLDNGVLVSLDAVEGTPAAGALRAMAASLD